MDCSFADSLSEEHLMQLSRTGFPLVLLLSHSHHLKIPFVLLKTDWLKIIDHLIEKHAGVQLFSSRPQGQEDSKAANRAISTQPEGRGIAIDKAFYGW
jgi:hypothetical protein